MYEVYQVATGGKRFAAVGNYSLESSGKRVEAV